MTIPPELTALVEQFPDHVDHAKFHNICSMHGENAVREALQILKADAELQLYEEIRVNLPDIHESHAGFMRSGEAVIEQVVDAIKQKSQKSAVHQEDDDFDRHIFLANAKRQLLALNDSSLQVDCYLYLQSLQFPEDVLEDICANLRKSLLLQLHTKGFDKDIFDQLTRLGCREQALQVAKEAVWMTKSFSFDDMLDNGRRYKQQLPPELARPLLCTGLFELLASSSDLFKLDDGFLKRYKDSRRFIRQYLDLFGDDAMLLQDPAKQAFEDKWPLCAYFNVRYVPCP